MLHTLHVRNLALIESAEIRLDEHLNVISGETGGGKSLLITALKLVRGEKAQASLIRHGQDELQVDAEFRLSDGDRSRAVIELVSRECGGAIEDGLLLVTRIVDRQGRSRVRIGGRPATIGFLRQLGEFLVEIHGQGDSRALMRAGIQCETLDAFAGTTPQRAQFAAALTVARDVERRLRATTGAQQERRQRVEFLRFQSREMTELRLVEGELEQLVAEHQILANLDVTRQRLQAALGALQDEDANASELLAVAVRSLREAALVDRRLEDSQEALDEASELVAEVCRKLQSGLARLDLDPRRLEAVEARLDEVHRALQRFGPTEADFRRNLVQVTAELLAADNSSDDPDALAVELAGKTEAVAVIGRKLMRARRKAAEPFAEQIGRELKDLGMVHTQVRVVLKDEVADSELLAQATEHGPSVVDFEVRINPGEPFRSMKDTASGGELARIVLAIKKTLADQDRVPLLVLDEIDAEIGGRLGLQVGQKLHDVALHHQVVIVTHLPQVAAFANRHFLVNKEIAGKGAEERTRSQVRQLKGHEVERELAAMTTGDGDDLVALNQARSLVRRARPDAAGAADA
ncbi:MAG: DNA repair protein RecN [Planctomycetota bacterium]|nr:DNA repair protein RecN [Planctomycetota bacterium]MSR39915.1 DNA repair protein RecN [Planctomycetota bacterium]